MLGILVFFDNSCLKDSKPKYLAIANSEQLILIDSLINSHLFLVKIKDNFTNMDVLSPRKIKSSVYLIEDYSGTEHSYVHICRFEDSIQNFKTIEINNVNKCIREVKGVLIISSIKGNKELDNHFKNYYLLDSIKIFNCTKNIFLTKIRPEGTFQSISFCNLHSLLALFDFSEGKEMRTKEKGYYEILDFSNELFSIKGMKGLYYRSPNDKGYGGILN